MKVHLCQFNFGVLGRLPKYKLGCGQTLIPYLVAHLIRPVPDIVFTDKNWLEPGPELKAKESCDFA